MPPLFYMDYFLEVLLFYSIVIFSFGVGYGVSKITVLLLKKTEICNESLGSIQSNIFYLSGFLICTFLLILEYQP
jgi:hypothetical protein